MAFNYFDNSSFIGIKKHDRATGVQSLSSEQINFAPTGGHTFWNSGIHTWIAPAGVSFISVLCIGGGGGGMYYNSTQGTWAYAMNGGGGGGLAWVNEFPVNAGQGYICIVGAAGTGGAYSAGSTAGGESFFVSTTVCKGFGGSPGRYNQDVAGGGYFASSSYGTSGGGSGGAADMTSVWYQGPCGGGGAGGYTGNGGTGRQYNESATPAAGSGGGSGGGATGVTKYSNNAVRGWITGGGGGTAIHGEGTSGAAGTNGASAGGGEGSADILSNTSLGLYSQHSTSGGPGISSAFDQTGGDFGGGGGGRSSTYYGGSAASQNGGKGVVRIIWGPGRAWPTTGDLSYVDESFN
jgi:hypothetical protein